MASKNNAYFMFFVLVVACTPFIGKCEVDAINGVDKNTIHMESMKQVADPEKVFKSSSSTLQTFSYNNVPGEMKHSAAENCKAVLERCGSEGVKSEGKRVKREREGHEEEVLAREKTGRQAE